MRCVFSQRRRAQRGDLGSRMPNEPSSTLRATIGILRQGGPRSTPTKHQAGKNDESRSGFELMAKRESTPRICIAALNMQSVGTRRMAMQSDAIH